MSDKDNGGPAFPWCGDLNDCLTINLGMNLRDYFAAKIVCSLIGSVKGEVTLGSGYQGNNEKFAKAAYSIADAMIAERAK